MQRSTTGSNSVSWASGSSGGSKTPKSLSKSSRSFYSSPGARDGSSLFGSTSALSAQFDYDPAVGIEGSEYPFRLSLYYTPPYEEISLEDFETFALHRLSLLRTVEMGIARNLKDSDLEDWIKKAEDKYMPLHHSHLAKSVNLDGERRKDNISHFILSMAFCRTDDLRRWFISQESALFKYRFNNEMDRDRLGFLGQMQFSMETCKMTEQEKDALKQRLIGASPSVSLANWAQVSYYKVPFEQVPDLVMRRCVYVRRGIAYIPSTEISSLVLSTFKEGLELKLEQCAKALPKLDEDERVLPMLKNFGLVNLVDLGGAGGSGLDGSDVRELRANQVDAASLHFPPCMSHLHRKLREESHLRHGGRMQYGLFLKSIGLKLEEALMFWRAAFSRRTADDAFQKNYAYNIRHNYGQEGKRANYTPFSCLKIIMGTGPASGDHHGCPFKHFGPESLSSMLSNYRYRGGSSSSSSKIADSGVALASNHMEEIKALVQRSHFQLACTKLFEYTRQSSGSSGSVAMDTFVNPSEFYEASMRKANNEGGEEEGKDQMQ